MTTLNSPWPIRSRGFGFVEYSSMEQVDACQVSQPIRLQYFLGSGSILLLYRLTVSPYLQNISIVVSGNLTWEGERRSNKLLFSFKIVTGNCFLSGFHFFVYGLIIYVTKVSMVIFVHPRKCKHNYSISSISPTEKVGSRSATATQWWKCFFYAVVNIMLEK